MNLIDCYVTKILGEPYRMFGHWWVEAEYESEGRPGKTGSCSAPRKLPGRRRSGTTSRPDLA